jgi:hypothetical protein
VVSKKRTLSSEVPSNGSDKLPPDRQTSELSTNSAATVKRKRGDPLKRTGEEKYIYKQ